MKLELNNKSTLPEPVLLADMEVGKIYADSMESYFNSAQSRPEEVLGIFFIPLNVQSTEPGDNDEAVGFVSGLGLYFYGTEKNYHVRIEAKCDNSDPKYYPCEHMNITLTF